MLSSDATKARAAVVVTAWVKDGVTLNSVTREQPQWRSDVGKPSYSAGVGGGGMGRSGLACKYTDAVGADPSGRNPR
jgi:hypothetical protein